MAVEASLHMAVINRVKEVEVADHKEKGFLEYIGPLVAPHTCTCCYRPWLSAMVSRIEHC